jgi:Methyltransferase domain
MTNLRGLSTPLATRYFRELRLRLPQPWSRRVGQLAYLPLLARGHEATRREFAEEAVIERLLVTGEPLLGIGAGLSERVVEIPWVIRRLGDRGRRVLDAGTAFAPMVYKRQLIRRSQTVEMVDLAATEIPGLASHVGDLRALPFASGSFDLAICVSTLEHVGLDNAQYGIESGGDGDSVALRELGRVAGTVLVTVPAGRDENMGWQRQYTPQTFLGVVEAAGLRVEVLDVFAHDPDAGWSPAEPALVERRGYGEGAVAAAASICAELSSHT